MKITKIGHCCLVVKEQGLTILTDPGAWTVEQNSLKGIDIVLITHEHADHFHVDSLKQILSNNPEAKVVTNSAVGKILDAERISYEVLEHGQNIEIQGVLFEAFGEKHSLIYNSIPQVQNTGFFIAGRLFYPGDAFTNPGKEVEILALPVCGPWMHMAEALDYALELKPKVAFPVHDAMLKIYGPFHKLPETILNQNNIQFIIPELGKEIDF